MNGTDFPLRPADLERLGISVRFVMTDNEGTRARALENAHLLNASKDLLFALQCCIGSLSVVSPGGDQDPDVLRAKKAVAKALGERA